MIIDFHAHCFPVKIAAPALEKLSRSAGALTCRSDGTLDGSRKLFAQNSIDLAVMLNIAVTPAQQKSVNDFTAQINGGAIGFGSVHPFAPDALEELERIHSMGIKGVKFHPHYQKFPADDKAAFPVYRKAASLGLITVFHAGHDLSFADNDIASPAAIARALSAFDGAPVVAAHLGGSMCWQDARKHLAGLPVYLDTAFCHGNIPLPEAQAILDRHGADRVLFGTDLPWSGIREEMDFVASLGLSPRELGQVMGGNAARLLGI